MKSKWTLFTGILLLVVGILLRRLTGLGSEGLILIITGVLLKTFYIISKARSGEYKPGYELIFLVVGLAMFMTGIYLRSHQSPFNPLFLILPGIALKVVFILMFIQNTRSNRKEMDIK